jgi:hypothetical protein
MADNRNQSPGQPQGQSRDQRASRQPGQGGQSAEHKSAHKTPADQPGPRKDKELAGQERGSPSHRAEPGYSAPQGGAKDKGETEGTHARQDKPGGMGGQGGERTPGRR